MDEPEDMEYNEMEQENNWVIEVQDVSYTYDGDSKKALDGLNLNITAEQRSRLWEETVRENPHCSSA